MNWIKEWLRDIPGDWKLIIVSAIVGTICVFIIFALKILQELNMI